LELAGKRKTFRIFAARFNRKRLDKERVESKKSALAFEKSERLLTFALPITARG
jgi:hypothetical protein